MARAALRRLLGAAAVMFGISVIVFALFFATPGADPAARIAGRGASPETLAQVRQEFGLDRPLPVQYAILMRRLFVTQDLASYVNRGQLVVPALMRAAPVSLSLVAGAAVLWVLGAFGIGLFAAWVPSRAVDRLVLGLGLLGASVPVFWLGEVVNLVTQSRLHGTALFSWVPPLGYQPLRENPAGWFKALLIPWLTLASLYAGLYGRLLRASLAEAYREDYIRTARAKGLGEGRILLRHALRNSLVSFVSLFGLDFGALVGGGALLTEVVFGLHGVGKLTYDAMRNLDLPVIMAAVLFAAFFVVLANLAVDLIYAALDPRVRRA
jgi:peptide/nickel transport system permease protein